MKTNYPNVYKYFNQEQIAYALNITVDSFRRSKRKEKYIKAFDELISIVEQKIIDKILK